MRVLIVTSLYPRPGYETNATFHRRLFTALAKNHEVTILAPLPWTLMIRPPRDTGGRGVRLPRWSRDEDGIWVARPRSYFTPKVLTRHYGAMFRWSIGPTFRRLVDQVRPDVVLGSWAHPDGWAAVKLAHRAGLPAVMMVIGSDILVATRNPARRRRIVEGLREADRVLAVSRDLANHVEDLGVNAEKVDVLHTGVDPVVFHPGDRDESRRRLGLDAMSKRVLYVGNLYLSKGVGVLLDALRILKSRGVAFACDLVGGGGDEPRLLAQATAAGLGDVVTFRGRRPHDELADWYRSCDVLALPSDSEGIPNVLREATACGRPWVATRVGGIPEIADPAVDRLVPPRDPEAIADAIASTLADPPSTLDSLTRVPCPTWDESARRLADRLALAIADHEGRS